MDPSHDSQFALNVSKNLTWAPHCSALPVTINQDPILNSVILVSTQRTSKGAAGKGLQHLQQSAQLHLLLSFVWPGSSIRPHQALV